MTNLWMPGAAQHPVGNTGAMNGGPSRAVWHITSNSNDHTFSNELGWFTGGGADVAPHLLYDPFTGEIAQLFPADSRSLSLQNAGTVKTNRTGKCCIQIEVVFTEGETLNGKRYNSVAETPCKNLGSIMAWLRSLGIPDVWPGGAPTGFVRDTVSLDTWLNQGGHYGHNQIPGNSHVDPGPMPNLFADAPKPPTPTPPKPANGDAFPGADKFGPGADNAYVTRLGTMLCARGGRRFYSVGPGPKWGAADQAATQAFQTAQGWTGGDADGIPGPTTWHLLVTGGGHDIPAVKPAPPAKPTVDLSKLVQAAETDPGAAQGHQTYAAGVRLVEAALVAEGLLAAQYAGDGSYGTKTRAAYAAWQKRAGVGGPYDGIPGPQSLTKLGQKHGFVAVA